MSMGLHPAYCARCNSHHCPCAIQINAHNMRMQNDRLMMGMANATVTATRWPEMPEMVARLQEPADKPLPKEPPNKKLLLLRRSR